MLTVTEQADRPSTHEQPEPNPFVCALANRITSDPRAHTVPIQEVEEHGRGGDPYMLWVPLGCKDEWRYDCSNGVVNEIERLTISMYLQPI
jgi:hypothetical protein